MLLRAAQRLLPCRKALKRGRDEVGFGEKSVWKIAARQKANAGRARSEATGAGVPAGILDVQSIAT